MKAGEGVGVGEAEKKQNQGRQGQGGAGLRQGAEAGKGQEHGPICVARTRRGRLAGLVW